MDLQNKERGNEHVSDENLSVFDKSGIVVV